MTRNDWMAVAALGFAGLFAAMHRQAVAGVGGVLTKAEVRLLAARLIARHGLRADADVAASLAMIESSGNPQATRYEPYIPHLGRADYSTGLMQVLVSTAQWLADDMGYRAYGPTPTGAAMLDPETGMYYGLAYLDYLARYRGGGHSLDWIVQSYNAGPGNSSPAYLAKFRTEHGG